MVYPVIQCYPVRIFNQGSEVPYWLNWAPKTLWKNVLMAKKTSRTGPHEVGGIIHTMWRWEDLVARFFFFFFNLIINIVHRNGEIQEIQKTMKKKLKISNPTIQWKVELIFNVFPSSHVYTNIVILLQNKQIYGETALF